MAQRFSTLILPFLLLLLYDSNEQHTVSPLPLSTTSNSLPVSTIPTPLLDVSLHAANMKLYPEVMVKYENRTETFQLVNTSKYAPAGIYRNLLRDGKKLRFGCGVRLDTSYHNGNKTLNDSMWPMFNIELSIVIVISDSVFLYQSCSGGDKDCWELVYHQDTNTTNLDHPFVHYGSYATMTEENIKHLHLDSSDQTSVFCVLHLRDSGKEVKANVTFDWWELPSSLEMTPATINGYHRQDHTIEVSCKSTGGYPLPPPLSFDTCLERECGLRGEKGYQYEQSTYYNGSSLVSRITLDHHRHHDKQLLCSFRDYGFSITGSLEDTVQSVRLEKPIYVRYVSRGIRTIPSYRDTHDDIYVDVHKYLYYVGELEYNWTTVPTFTDVHNGNSNSVKLNYEEKGSARLTNVTCVVTLKYAPEVANEDEAIRKGYRVILNFQVVWGRRISIRDTTAFVTLIALGVIGTLSCIGAYVATCMQNKNKGRRATFATGMGSSFEADFDQSAKTQTFNIDKDEENDVDEDEQAEVKISPGGTVTVTMKGVSPSCENVERRSSLASRRTSGAGRLSIDERRRTLANEALMLAESVKKSIGGRKSVGGRSVSFAGNALPPGAEELARIPGTDIFIRKSLVTNRRDTICEEAEEDIQPAEGPLKTGTEQCTDTKVPTVTQPEQEHPTHDIAPLVASDSPTGISPIIEMMRRELERQRQNFQSEDGQPAWSKKHTTIVREY